MSRYPILLLASAALLLSACGSAATPVPTAIPTAVPPVVTPAPAASGLSVSGWDRVPMSDILSGTSGTVVRPAGWVASDPHTIYATATDAQMKKYGFIAVLSDMNQTDLTYGIPTVTIAKVAKTSGSLHDWAVANVAQMYGTAPDYQILATNDITLPIGPAVEIQMMSPAGTTAGQVVPRYFLMYISDTAKGRYVFYGAASSDEVAARVFPYIRAIVENFAPTS